MDTSFVLSGCPIIADTIPIDGAGRIADIASLWDLQALSRKPKLLPHFGKACTAIFFVQEIKYGGHASIPVV
jgi:hypothetical protein